MNELSPYAPHSPSCSQTDETRREINSQPEGFRFEDEEEARLNPLKYWYILLKHRWLVLAAFVVGLSMATYSAFTATRLYTATSVLLISPHIPDMLGDKNIAPELGPGDEYSTSYYKTQYEMLKSRRLAGQVIDTLDLGHDKSFLGTNIKPSSVQRLEASLAKDVQPLISWGSSHPIKTHVQSNKESPERSALINQYQSMISVIPVQDTSLVNLQVTSSSPSLSSEISNAHAQAYQQLGITLHDQANQGIVTFLKTKLKGLQSDLEQSATKLNTYRRDNGLTPGLISLDGKQTVVLDRLSDLSKDLTATEVERIGLGAQVQVIASDKSGALPAIMENANVQTLQNSLNSEEADVASLSSRFTPDYPPLAQLQAKANATRARLNDEVHRIRDTIDSSYRAALAKENALRGELDEQKQEALKLNDAAVQYEVLQREVDTNRQLIDQVLQKIKDVSIEAESDTSNAIIVDNAEPPKIPSSPKKMHEIAQGGLVGLVFGIMLSLGVEYMRDTLITPEEVESYLHLSNLGVVPEFSVEDKKCINVDFNGKSAPPEISPPYIAAGLVSELKGYSLTTEGYRSVRTGLLLSRAGSPPRLVLVTSAIAGEGKTVTVINTAIMMAHAGARVLIIDADLRRGRCGKMFGRGAGPGLTEFLIGVLPAEQVITPTAINRLFLMPAGTLPPNSTELVGSQRMRDLLDQMTKIYDFVVVDSPPVIPVSDALVLSKMVDGVVLVIDSRRTPKSQVKAAQARLRYARAKIFGFVLNRMSPSSLHYHYHYYSEAEADSRRPKEAS
jgi:succinoglycan biosynthesis transport protein ExoP